MIGLADLERALGFALERDGDDLGEVLHVPVRFSEGTVAIVCQYPHSSGEIALWGPETLTLEVIATEIGLDPSVVVAPPSRAEE